MELSNQTASSNGHILIIDDNFQFCAFLKLSLEAEGFSVNFAPEAVSGLATIESSVPSMVLVSEKLPMQNLKQLTEGLQNSKSTIPLVLMTSLKDAEKEAQDLGFDHHLEKPFIEDNWFRVMRQFLPA
jgi:two-component system, sensor histidine kinase and response regulator